MEFVDLHERVATCPSPPEQQVALLGDLTLDKDQQLPAPGPSGDLPAWSGHYSPEAAPIGSAVSFSRRGEKIGVPP